MRDLSASLAMAQRKNDRQPYVQVTASNRANGTVRPDWQRFYTGSEADCPHSLTLPGDGSLVRARLTPPTDSRKLYRQRISNPGPASDFSAWEYSGQYNCLATAAASSGAEVCLFLVNSSREIKMISSSDYGANWSSPQIVGYTTSTSVYGLAAAYKPNGDLAVVFAVGNSLYIKRRTGGSWQGSTAWDKTTGDLSSLALVYESDWNIVLTGRDTDGNFKVWSLVYGDGGDVASGAWSDLQEVASAPADGEFEYRSAFLDRTDVTRLFFVEKFNGTESYSRPFYTSLLPGAAFSDNLWLEPVPFNLSSQYGPAIAHAADHCWLSTPDGVWRAALTETSLDISADVLYLKMDTTRSMGRVELEIRNDEGAYAVPPYPLGAGGCLEIGPGYITGQGVEVSPGLSFRIESLTHISRPGRAALVLAAFDGWDRLGRWQARQHFRWNKTTAGSSIKDILRFVLARCGLALETVSQSGVITSFCPDFSIRPGEGGKTVVGRLLSSVPDKLFIEGDAARLVNPLETDSPVYAYGEGHAILEGTYFPGTPDINRVRVEGYDSGSGTPILVDSFAWEQIEKLADRLLTVEDKNIDSVSVAADRGAARLRTAALESSGGEVLVPVNCGQQLYDVVEIDDARAGLNGAKKRVLGMSLVYHPRRGRYDQRLYLGSV